jgi:membrane protein implicated in regulation of membrane protease activity
MIWWLWVLLGLALLSVELVTPGAFFFLFFGLAACVVGGLAGLGLLEPFWLQWVVFSALSILALATLRGTLKARLNLGGAQKPVDSFVGGVALALQDLPPAAFGKVEVRGTSWNAHNGSGTAIAKGQRCVVDKVDGLTFWVRPE